MPSTVHERRGSQVIFKRLELQGFKSFSDRTEVNFKNGINAVVGPNGCGKSNIADAIRWVLGEQSPKKLRGEQMEDLIFSGSDSRKPLGMAEVSLTVESSGCDFPPPYDTFTELAVTRRLYRSGESEFYINNTPCRLRDIRELFMDTGLNPKAYAVIDQGHIGNIVSARPEDRRILIEEAAGIARYKERKAAALRKLDATEHNLLRLHDIIREIKRQIRSLKLQATKAEKYNRLRREIEELELKLLYQQYHTRIEENRSLEAKGGNLEEIREVLRGQAVAEEAGLETGRLSLAALDKEVAAAREDYYSHRAQSESVEHQLQSSRTRTGEIGGALARNESEAERLSTLIDGFEGERSQVTEELQALETRLEEQQTRRQQAEGELDRLAETAGLVKTRLEEANAGFLEQMRVEGESQNRVTQAETLRDSLRRELERFRGEIQAGEEEERQLRQHLEELQSQLVDRKKEREDLRQTQESTAVSLRKVREELEEVEQQLHRAREEYAQASSRMASLTELEQNLSGWPERFRRELDRVFQDQKRSGQVKGLLANFVKAQPEYETALEAVLGEKLKYLLVGTRETALEAARALRSEGEVRGTLLPLEIRTSGVSEPCAGAGVIGPLSGFLSTAEEHRQVIDHLLRDVILMEDLTSAMALWSANGASRTFVTAAGEVLWPDGSLTAGPLDPARELLPLIRRMGETEKAAAEREGAVTSLARRREELRGKLEASGQEEEQLVEACYQADIDLSSLEKDLAHARQKVTFREEARRGLSAALSRTVTEMEDLEETLNREQSLKSELEGGREQQKAQITALTGELAELRRKENDLGGQADALRVELAAGRERVTHLDTRLERLAGDRGDSERRREELIAELTRLREEREGEDLRTGKLEGRLRELSGSREDRERRLAELQERHRLAAGGILETEENLRRIRLRSDELREESAGLQAKSAEVQVRLENLKERVAEIRACPPEELWDEETRTAVAEELHGEIEERHDEMAGKLQSLGPVNLAAIGDHRELQERLEFQVSQQEDIQKASQDLRQAIQKINATSRKKFLETFEQVNEKFQEVFPILFSKGQAMLRLSEAEDPLDAGIEILAQPAGKKLQRLSLLSGGEKALSAIALLLAIFMVKPTPFCLLDEVDAPLDDTNTGRFLELLKTSINGSQLVVITHNKQTMERAGNLVGVTMSDPGVSSLISVTLRDN
jgi:chromosome segregation protein